MTIFDILHEYQLDSINNLPARLETLTISDWLHLSNTLDTYYTSSAMPEDRATTTPLTFFFPSLPANLLTKISAHLLISDRVFLDDPFYDLAALLGEYVFQSTNDSYVNLLAEVKLHVTLARKVLLANAMEIIRFYLSARELIEEGRLILYKQLQMPKFSGEFIRALSSTIRNDKRLQTVLYGNSNLIRLNATIIVRAMIARGLGKPVIDFVGRSRFVRASSARFAEAEPLLSSLALLAISGSFQGSSTDFIHPDYAYVFRKALEVASQLNVDLPPTNRLLLPAGFAENGMQVPILRNVPVERVLDIISQEPSAFESFRLSLNSKLLKISAPVSSIEREKQVLEIKESIQNDVVDITMAYEEIQKSFAKKFAVNAILGSSAILVAGASAIGQNLDVLSIAGSIFAGTTISASIKEFAKEWLDYQQELLKLKSRENYFVWKVLPRH